VDDLVHQGFTAYVSTSGSKSFLFTLDDPFFDWVYDDNEKINKDAHSRNINRFCRNEGVPPYISKMEDAEFYFYYGRIAASYNNFPFSALLTEEEGIEGDAKPTLRTEGLSDDSKQALRKAILLSGIC
jgi:hypothetical protein